MRGAAVQQTQTYLLSEAAGQGVDPEIHHPVPVAATDPAVLSLASLSDIEVRQDLEAGGHRWDQPVRKRLHVLLEHTVLAVAQTETLLLRLHMDVGGAHGHGLQQDAIHQGHHR